MSISKVLIIILCFVFVSMIASKEETNYKIDYDNLKAYKPEGLIKGNIEKGRKIFISRKVNCLSCHEAPIEEEKFQGNFGPSLINVGERYTKEELRLIVINPKIINPDTIMPSYFTKINNFRTPEDLKNKTILNINEVEDIVEYLYSLKE